MKSKSEMENEFALATCEGPHDFVCVLSYFREIWRCKKCGGVVSTNDATWYMRGLAHGAADGKVSVILRKQQPGTRRPVSR